MPDMAAIPGRMGQAVNRARPGARPLSVAVATRDRPAELARCLDALLAGEVLPDQITVVDQGRDSRTREVVEQRRAGPVPITYVLQPPRGLSASRNAAVAHAEAATIAFTDDDCVPHRSWVRRLHEAFSSSDPPDIVTGRVLALGPDRPGAHAVSLRTAVAPAEYHGRTVPWRVGTGANIAASSEWIHRVGGFDERLGAGSHGRAAEDADLIYRLLVMGARVRYEPEAIVYHERLSNARRLATRSGYGYGVGALCGMHLRRGDLFALSMLGNWTSSLARRLRKAGASRDRFELLQVWLSLRATVAGFGYGLGCRPTRGDSAAPCVR